LHFAPGVEPTGLKAGQRAPFTVDAKAAGDGELDVFVEGPQGEEKVDIRNNGDGTYSCMYYPNKFGKYIVNVTWSSVQVPNSPFNVKVAPAVDASRIKAYGPGLEKGNVMDFVCFRHCDRFAVQYANLLESHNDVASFSHLFQLILETVPLILELSF